MKIKHIRYLKTVFHFEGLPTKATKAACEAFENHTSLTVLHNLVCDLFFLRLWDTVGLVWRAGRWSIGVLAFDNDTLTGWGCLVC